MRNIVLKIAYDGTNYCGWQIQPNAVSVAGEITAAIEKITKVKPCLYGSGRTDSGVHAYEQTANFYTESKIEPYKLVAALNSKLPRDIRITGAREAGENFNSRFDAKGKTYIYRIVNNSYLSPFEVNRAWLVKMPLDEKKMQQAAARLVGTHDFKAFMAAGSYVKDCVRTLYEVEAKRSGELITIRVSGNGFLYNMVRIIAGTLVFAGIGKLSADEVEGILKGCDRTRGAITAPACGLYLKEVWYE